MEAPRDAGNAPREMSRTAAREVAVRLCYCAELRDCWDLSITDAFFSEEYYRTLAEEDPLFERMPNAEQFAYICKLFDEIGAHRGELDGYISKYAKGWTVSRISKISVAVLRCAMCEMLYMEDASAAVAINEAVEIAKHYEEPETVSFINGVLGSFYRGERENP